MTILKQKSRRFEKKTDNVLRLKTFRIYDNFSRLGSKSELLMMRTSP